MFCLFLVFSFFAVQDFLELNPSPKRKNNSARAKSKSLSNLSNLISLNNIIKDSNNSINQVSDLDYPGGNSKVALNEEDEDLKRAIELSLGDSIDIIDIVQSSSNINKLEIVKDCVPLRLPGFFLDEVSSFYSFYLLILYSNFSCFQ
jgi:hypothetical protein